MDDERAIPIRAAGAADWPRLCAIYEAARQEEGGGPVAPDPVLIPKDAAEADGLLDGSVLVAELGGEVAGFVAVDGDEITWLYVDPAVHRRGVGRALLRRAVPLCGPAAWVEALAGNEAAIGLYESEGFRAVETTSGPVPACRMRRMAESFAQPPAASQRAPGP